VALKFGINDEESFHQTRDELLDEMEQWAAGRTDVPEDNVMANASIFLDWRVGYSTGEIDQFSVGDVDEYLIDWCPQKMLAPPEVWPSVVSGVKAWIKFLVSTDRWCGEPVEPVLNRLDSIGPKFADAMARSEMADVDDNGPVQLPPIISPSPQDVALSAEQAPILSQIDAVADYLGAGRALSATGGLKLADAHQLLDIVATEDIRDDETDGLPNETEPAAHLPHLNHIYHSALNAGALRKHDGMVMPVDKWAQQPPVDRVGQMFTAMITFGPVSSRGASRQLAEVDKSVEAGLPHWMVPLVLDHPVDVDDLVQQSLMVIGDGINDEFGDPDRVKDMVATRVEYNLDVVERCGLVTRTGDRNEASEFAGRKHRRGGQLHITDLGRHLLPSMLNEAGYSIPMVDDFDSLEPSIMLEIVSNQADDDIDGLWGRWWPNHSEQHKIQAVIDALLVVGHPMLRLTGFTLLNSAAAEARPILMQLLDGPLADHAAMFLVDNGFMDKGEVFPMLAHPPIAPVVDLLAVELEADPANFPEAWSQIIRGDDAVGRDMIELMWRVPYPEAEQVLAGLGRLLSDKSMAKLARSAAFKARTNSSS